jgi:hypothetical protein
MIRLAIALALALLGTANASAYSSENVEPVLQKYKLSGQWRNICHAPIDNDNDEVDFVKQKDGTVIAFRTPAFVILFFVLDAEPLTGRYVRLRVRAANVTTPGLQTIVLEVGQDVLRFYSNISDNGQKFIDEGILVGSGKPTPYMSRCQK